MSKWRPIKTAPTDGTSILIGSFGEGTTKPGLIEVDWYRQPKDKRGFIGFGSFNKQFFPPTHWQPMPTPPANQDKGRG